MNAEAVPAFSASAQAKVDTVLGGLACTAQPDQGEVTVGGLAPQQAARQRRIGLVFQDATLLPWKNALENAAFLQMTGANATGAIQVERALTLSNVQSMSFVATRRNVDNGTGNGVEATNADASDAPAVIDITSGNNQTFTTRCCAAGPGYDLASGWGLIQPSAVQRELQRLGSRG